MTELRDVREAGPRRQRPVMREVVRATWAAAAGYAVMADGSGRGFSFASAVSEPAGDHRIHLCGVSLGARVALAFAVERPERFFTRDGALGETRPCRAAPR